MSNTVEPQNELTDIKTKEVSLVDRAANQRTFLVRKRRDGDPVAINPLLAEDKELVAMDAADKGAVGKGAETPAVIETAPAATETPAATDPAPAVIETAPAATETPAAATETPVDKTKTSQRCSVCGGFLDRANLATGICARCQEKGVTAAKSETAPAAAAATETAPAAAAATETAPAAAATETAPAAAATEPAPAAAATEPAPAVATTEPVIATVKSDSCGCCAPQKYVPKIQPALRASIIAGVNAILARAQEAKALAEATESDVSGDSWVPYDICIQLRMIDTLADTLLGDIGGTAFEAAAILAGAAASVGAEVAGSVSKAGAAMAASRLQKFTNTHGDMGSALKALGRCHKAMGDMLTELRPGVEKSDETITAPTPVPASAPITVPAPVPATNTAVGKSATTEISKSDALAQQVLDLQRTVAQQGALLQKMRTPSESNAIPFGENSPSSATIKTDAWPDDMGEKPERRPGRRFDR